MATISFESGDESILVDVTENEQTQEEAEHAAIVAKCMQLDAFPRLVVYSLESNKHTFALSWTAYLWHSLTSDERYVMVKNRNIFMSKEEALAAKERAFNHLI